ncbi:MAG: HisA/HisF-related TIM barrel protein, partial [Candidatus Bathyarchaeia archaeon]
MKVFPAIDLMNGKVVRLTKGDPKTVKTYDHLGDPLTLAKRWEREGVDGLHIVDLDATLGLGNNLGTIIKIVKETALPIHVGGGIRSLETAENLLNSGVSKVILGTLAYKNPDVVTEL